MTSPNPDIMTIKVDGQDRDFIMSFGLVEELANHVGNNIELMSVVLVDHDMRRLYLSSLLAERSETGKRLKDVDIYDVRIETSDVLLLLEWATLRVTDFLLSAAKAAVRTATSRAEEVKALVSSLSGSKT
jgi:hypothetical protein